jgi:hypothetical protein
MTIRRPPAASARLAASVIVATLAVSSSAPAQPNASGWLDLDVVGVSVSVPAAFVSATEPPLLFEDPRGAEIARYPSGIDDVRFAVAAVDAAGARPHDVAAAIYDPGTPPEVTYRVDRSELGVVSGTDAGIIFYSACKRRDGRIACFSLSYPERHRALVDPAIATILRSLR